MAGGPVSRVAVALGSATTDTEEGRAFFQERLRLYTGWVFVLSGLFLLLNISLARRVWVPSFAAHFLATLVMGVAWAATRGPARSIGTLRWLDGAALIVSCALFGLMGRGIGREHIAAGMDPTSATLAAQLACVATVFTRAVAVPSTPARTLWLGAAALIPQVALAAWTFADAAVLLARPPHATPTGTSVAATLHVLAWCAVAVAISTVGSRVIFGLRAEASKVKRLGQYVLEEKIGEGGMGIVYRASHAMLRRPTAIKLLPPERAGEESIGRFEREVRLTAQLSHPSTIAIFDYGRTPTGVFYYAMEYLDGLNLQELVERDGAQPPGRVIHLLEQVTGALSEAHDAGLIHRDIKPANIILCERGGVPDVAKVVDFGLVKHATLAADEATMLQTAGLVLTGTPLYMAPETISGEAAVDPRSDLYALGAVAYFLLTGRPVFEARTVVEVLAHHLHTTPSRPSEAGPNRIPFDLEGIVLRCLAKTPDARFASARELGQALHEAASRTPWPTQEALRWWSAYKRDRAPRAAAAVDGAPTLAVDLDERTVR